MWNLCFRDNTPQFSLSRRVDEKQIWTREQLMLLRVLASMAAGKGVRRRRDQALHSHPRLRTHQPASSGPSQGSAQSEMRTTVALGRHSTLHALKRTDFGKQKLGVFFPLQMRLFKSKSLES
ncbi:hypothetical protein AVEN_205501-1 [Araneus ventricosus]|uniref:Uncharacterized protein n=1 Tax=Araneus ventricosus TaxID=182803 RepID=A0A4Y2LB07_ARAVE|nr:hypothetical protein AVEN_205501-1 [Araneus ventricosus]